MSLPTKLIVLSVGLTFKSSHNEVDPAFPMLLTGNEKMSQKKHLTRSSIVLTVKIEFNKCCVVLQCFAQCCDSSISNFVTCEWHLDRNESLVMNHITVFLILFTQAKSSSVSVVFVFSALPNEIAPLCLIPESVVAM